MNPIQFNYLNHRGEKALRTVTPLSVEYIAAPGFNYQPGWFLNGFCHDRQQTRTFAFTNIEPVSVHEGTGDHILLNFGE